MSLLDNTLKNVGMLDMSSHQNTQKRLDNLTKPLGSLGRLEEIAKNVVEITGKESPNLLKKAIFVMAADHGVADDSAPGVTGDAGARLLRVSAYPKAVTEQMVYNFVNGGAGINVLARHGGINVVVTDMGIASDLKNSKGVHIKKIGYGTKSMLQGPAMTREEARISVEHGIEVFETEFAKGMDIAGTGDMGIGNTTASSAITAVVTGASVQDVTGRGTGIDDEKLKFKIEVIKKAIILNKPDHNDGLDILAKVGGYEIGGIAGIIIGAASKRVPVVIDGFISGAAALVAYKIEPKTKDYMIASHMSVERGHAVIWKYLGLKPVLDLDLRLGEGTGAALAMHIIDAACKILTEMATFESANVSNI